MPWRDLSEHLSLILHVSLSGKASYKESILCKLIKILTSSEGEDWEEGNEGEGDGAEDAGVAGTLDGTENELNIVKE
jgi:hypothetical protein